MMILPSLPASLFQWRVQEAEKSGFLSFLGFPNHVWSESKGSITFIVNKSVLRLHILLRSTFNFVYRNHISLSLVLYRYNAELYKTIPATAGKKEKL